MYFFFETQRFPTGESPGNEKLFVDLEYERETAIETINELPVEFDLEELIEKLVFVDKVDKGLKQLDEGKTITHEAVKEITKKW